MQKNEKTFKKWSKNSKGDYIAAKVMMSSPFRVTCFAELCIF